MSSSPDLQCSHCTPPKKFRRREHLQRHLTSHTDSGPFACMFCEDSFKHNDTLKRHLKICKTRLNRRDGCSMRNLTWPFSPIQPSDNNFATVDELKFMKRMSTGAGLAECFNTGKSPRRTSLTFIREPDLPDDLSSPVMMPSAGDDLSKLFPELAGDLTQSSANSIWKSFTSGADPDALTQCVFVDHMEAVTTTIVLTLQEAVESRPNDSIIEIEWSPVMDGQCTRFFSPSNIRKFLDMFWKYWYPVCPILHQATFSRQSTPVPLLISMLLIGAQFSPDEGDRKASHIWFGATEEIVFNDQCFKDAVAGFAPMQRDCQCGMELLKHVQAALLMCVCQNWEGTPESKMRIRHYRYEKIISAARYLDPATASHKDLDLSNFNWCDFIETEEAIRTLHFIFCLDATFMVAYKIPPRMSVRELKMDLICHEDFFRAKSSQLCVRYIQKYREKTQTMNSSSVYLAMSQICSANSDEFKYVDKYNFFTLVSAIHVMIFYLQASLVLPETLAPITRGLQKWKRLWHENHPTATDKAKSGQYAVEFWVLGSALVQNLQKEEHIVGDSPEGYDTSDVRGLPSLLQDFHLQG